MECSFLVTYYFEYLGWTKKVHYFSVCVVFEWLPLLLHEFKGCLRFIIKARGTKPLSINTQENAAYMKCKNNKPIK